MTLTDLYTVDQLAELIGETPDTLRNWRRLPADHPRHLKAVRTPGAPGGYTFHRDAILEWLRQPAQARTLEVILGSFAPMTIRAGLFGLQIAEPTTNELTTTTETTNESPTHDTDTNRPA